MKTRKLVYVYDDQGRRVSRRVQELNDDNATYRTTSFIRFIYDGWNLIAELDESAHPLRTYVWGSDLSGTIQGAGGVGGLVMAKHWHVGDNATTFPAYDGNGNVRGLFRSDNGTIETYCSYDPFGQTFTYNNNPAAPNPFGFLTKPFDNETGLYYFGKRYKSDRWISRDQIGEKGGLNLYGYVGNEPVGKIDALGLQAIGIDPYGPYNPFNPWIPPNPFLPPSMGCPTSCPRPDDVRLNPYRAGFDAERKHFNLSPPNSPDPYSGGYRHCVAACLMVRTYGPLLGYGVIKCWDLTQERPEPGKTDTESDKKAERVGMDAAYRSGTCENECLTPYPPPPNYDPGHAPLPWKPNKPAIPCRLHTF